jgi:GNAT superfamily N-acetyltransferase
MRIRDARDDERDVLRHVVLSAYTQYASAVPESLWTAYRAQLLSTVDATAPVERIVADLTGTIVGCVLLFPPGAAVYSTDVPPTDYPEVRLLAVIPEARGKGIGAALMAECADRARQAGGTSLGLHTHDMMRAAVRMYERLGYRRTPEQDFAPAPGVLIKGYRLDLTS